MTSPNLDHINALILALPRGSGHLPMSLNLLRRFHDHRRFHYRGSPASFYPGTHTQQQFDFDFINSCEVGEWHSYDTGGFQARWTVRDSRRSWMHEVTIRAEMAREVALKGSLQLVLEGVERVKKVCERVCFYCDQGSWGKCTCDEQ